MAKLGNSIIANSYVGNNRSTLIYYNNKVAYSDTSLLLHMDGSNGSTTFTDSSTNNLTLTVNGSPALNTGIKKFGTASGLFPSSYGYLNSASSALFGFGTGDFTIETWIHPTNTGRTFYGFFNIKDYTNGILMRWHPSGQADSLYINGTFYNWFPATNAPVNTWTHVALVRYSGTVKMFAGGVNRIGTVTNTSDLGSTAVPTIGASAHAYSEGFYGYIDELRVIKGRALYTSDFTPPTAPFSY